MKLRGALLAVVIAATGCAMESSDLVGGDTSPSSTTSSIAQSSTSEATTTTTAAPTSTATTEAPTATTTTTSLPENASPWIGVEFTVETSHPRAEGIEILANVEHFPVDFLVGGEPAGVFGWYVGGVFNAFDGPDFSVVVVGNEPNPYAPTEWEQYEEGIEPVEPDPAMEHTVTVWAIEEVDPTRFVITDAMDLTLAAPHLHYGALTTVTQDPWLCDVDPSLQPYVDLDPAGIHRSKVLYAFFDSTDYEQLEIEERYPALLAFTVTDGTLAMVSPEFVRCVVRTDPENY